MNRCLPLASLLAFAPVLSLSSQTLRDTAECRTILEAPTRDSQLVRVVLHVRPFDSVAVRMSAAYRELIGDAIKTQLKVPHPLALTAVPSAQLKGYLLGDSTAHVYCQGDSCVLSAHLRALNDSVLGLQNMQVHIHDS